MSTVPVKAAERQAQAMVVGVRDLLVRQRTQAINAVRGYAAEFGVIAAPRHRPSAMPPCGTDRFAMARRRLGR